MIRLHTIVFADNAVRNAPCHTARSVEIAKDPDFLWRVTKSI